MIIVVHTIKTFIGDEMMIKVIMGSQLPTRPSVYRAPKTYASGPQPFRNQSPISVRTGESRLASDAY